ncbi:hypothetical protein ACE1B6_25265 [Aerosakkonemataceae cyanobacterium BLCC-F154]|uniref:Uncharacterized protein n=1 Tax=Floridaenema fluviatile BLCC-F154 TaxID=3153640 RepID=A0ABV4YJ89_9CYAN
MYRLIEFYYTTIFNFLQAPDFFNLAIFRLNNNTRNFAIAYNKISPISPINMAEKTSTLQKAIEVVEALSPDEQAILIDIIDKRLKQQRREQLLQEVAESERDYALGNVHRGSVSYLLAERDNRYDIKFN